LREIEQQVADQEQPAPESSPPAKKKVDLKKQSQFAPTLMGVTSFLKGDYGSKSADRVHENETNQSQFHAPALTKGAGKREKSLAAANSLIGWSSNS
jgi:hypothetical protein